MTEEEGQTVAGCVWFLSALADCVSAFNEANPTEAIRRLGVRSLNVGVEAFPIGDIADGIRRSPWVRKVLITVDSTDRPMAYEIYESSGYRPFR